MAKVRNTKQDMARIEDGECAKQMKKLLEEFQSGHEKKILKRFSECTATESAQLQAEYKAIMALSSWLSKVIASGKLTREEMDKSKGEQ